MKKMLSLVLALVLMLSMSLTVAAANGINGSSSGTVEVSYNTEESYIVTIPSDVALSTTGVNGTVKAESVLLEAGKSLTVSMASTNGFAVEYEDSAIAYTVEAGGSTISVADSTQAVTVLTVESGTTTGEETLTFKTTDTAIQAATQSGEHTDTLTFTCAVQ